MKASNLKVGIAKRDITPPVGLPLAGYGARTGTATGVADNLFARAFTIFDTAQNKRLAVIVADLVAFDPVTLQKFRERVKAETDVDPEHVIVAVTHTHSGPAYGSFYSAYNTTGTEGESEDAISWGAALPTALIEVLQQAITGEEYACVAITNTQVSLSTHRRYTDPLGEIRLAPNLDGVTDPNVGIIRATDARSGRVLGTLINYACHPVVLCEDNLQYSGDYPAYAVELLEQKTNAYAIFLNGACGNINPIARGDLETAKTLGFALAEAVEQALESTPQHTDFQLKISHQMVGLPVRFPSVEALQHYIDTAEQLYAAHKEPGNFEGQRLEAEVTRAREMAKRLNNRRQRLRNLLDDKGNIQVRLQVASLGSAAFVALPGEVFVEFGLELRKNAPFQPLFVFGYSNDAIGYVPVQEAYLEGGYEVDVSYLAPGAGEKLIHEALQSLQGLSQVYG